MGESKRKWDVNLMIHARGWLKNNNPPGDPNTAPRCGAKTRRGTACRCPAMHNGRCRIHGGLSTGPKTAEGIERIRRAVTKHGFYSKAARLERKQQRELLKRLRELVRLGPNSRMARSLAGEDTFDEQFQEPSEE